MSLVNISICVMFACCFSLMVADFPTTRATSWDARGNETDRLALLAFKSKITDDPLHALSSWNDSVHFCQWHGITCGSRHKRVTILDLKSHKLVGSISPHIGNLSFLRGLILQNNSFNHVIPPQIGHLKRLQYLYLHNNSLEGEIPANISACSPLISFFLHFNRLVGKIPAELGSLSKLKRFYFDNNILSGYIPSTLGNLSSLEEFFVSNNDLVGSIPVTLCTLPKLIFLVMAGNRLSGEIPPSLFNSSSVTTIDVTENQIQGSLPSSLGITLRNLRFLGIGLNKFTGSIPVSISNATDLEVLAVTHNNLTGKVPSVEKLQKIWLFLIAYNSLGSREVDDLSFLSSLTNKTSLEVLHLQSNNFGGELPESIANLSTTLAYYDLSMNHISGEIPIGILNLVNLNAIYMGANQFTGNIPHEIGRLQKLQEVHFQENNLSGNIPLSFGNLTSLSKILLNNNNLSGNIPSTLSKCQRLVLLDLRKNNLSGTIPPVIFGLPLLSIGLDLSQNHLTGTLPKEVGTLKNIEYLDVSNNELSGEVPIHLGRCVRLEFLSLHGNFFRGNIPSSLRSLRGISYLSLSHNNISGEIPDYMEELKVLQELDLSFNNLEGMVPTKGIFKNATAFSIRGNSELCGGMPELQLPICKYEGRKKRSDALVKILVSSIICGLVGLIFLVFFIVYFFFFKKRKNVTSSNSKPFSLLKVSYQSLFIATNGFSEANLIGMGSFGFVYKGLLDQDESIVAVKVLNLAHHGASKSFLAECEALRNIRHLNLLKVITACSSVDHQGNDFKALVYEFMKNGSLEEWLHPNLSENLTNEVPKKLNFLKRLNIAIDVACGLDYLHYQCKIPVVHCDLKPSNILLDDEMSARVGDFGLSRFLQTTICDATSHTSSIGVKGSIGYTAPEYGMGSEVSTSGDVYSFGILLLEMFTGKRPTDDMFRDGLNLHNFAKAGFPEKVEELADPVILQENADELTSANYSTQSNIRSSKFQGCLVSIFKIGLACSAELPRERMSSTDIVKKLYSVRDIFNGTGIHGARQTVTTSQAGVRSMILHVGASGFTS